MRTNGPHALIKSLPLRQCNHEGIRVPEHVPIELQKLGDTDQNFWYFKADQILNSCQNNSVLELVVNLTILV